MNNSRINEKDRSLAIVSAAKTDRPSAEKLVLELVNEIAPELGAQLASINESKLSLNSVNGRLDAENKKYFFKFHAEEGEIESLKNSEYYNAKLLAEAGWPVIQPIFTSSKPGTQFVVYEYIEAPTAFDAYEEQEARALAGNDLDAARVATLLGAEVELSAKVREGFLKTLELSERTEMENVSLQQLFYKRLVGMPDNPPRLESYYLGKEVALPNGEAIAFNDLAKMRWMINGIGYSETLGTIIGKAKDLIDPSTEERTPSVVGHGDDHNGNRFIINGKYVFFDPAFAGRQPALLSFIKATAHNVFVHPLWLYDPQKLEGKLDLKVVIEDGIITVDHNWKTEELSPLRMQILDIYAREVWKPLVAELSKRGWLPEYWQEYIRSALFCCPFLVLNLIDGKKYPPTQSLLALSKCVELGSNGSEDTLVEKFLRDITPRV